MVLSTLRHTSFVPLCSWYEINLYLTFVGNHFGSHPINSLIKWKLNNFSERMYACFKYFKWRQLYSTTKITLCITKHKWVDWPSTKAGRKHLAMNQNGPLNNILKQDNYTCGLFFPAVFICGHWAFAIDWKSRLRLQGNCITVWDKN